MDLQACMRMHACLHTLDTHPCVHIHAYTHLTACNILHYVLYYIIIMYVHAYGSHTFMHIVQMSY